MRKHISIHIIILSLILASCNPSLKSYDLTPENSFTEGVEGPATDHEGNIYAVNFEKQGTIGKVTPEGKAEVFVELPNGSIGNGIRFSNKTNMLVADYTNHNILEIDLNSKAVTVFAHHPEANQPNDLTIAPNGTVYASDPNWAKSTGNLWKVTKKNGFELLESNMGTTNGIEVNKEGTKLYVNESVQRNIWQYDILEDGSITNKTRLISFDDFGLDGMRFHTDGNLYACRFGKGVVSVISPKGKLLKELPLQGKNVTNITFSNDYKTAYVTVADRGCIETILLD